MNDALDLGGFIFAIIGATVVIYGVWRSWAAPKKHMSRAAYAEQETVQELVPVPVPGTSTENIGTALPPASRHMADSELIAVLALQRQEGKYRFSGNAIYALIKGNRADVLALVKEVRGEKMELVGDMIERVQREVQGNASNAGERGVKGNGATLS